MNKLITISVLIIMAGTILSSCQKDKDVTDSLNKGVNKVVFNADVTYGYMTDQDGNVYKTVTIGTQTWMAENLRTTRYNDGTEIPNVSAESWDALTTGAYCILYNVTDTNIINLYGRYYNWFAVNSGKLAPKGWHVPTNDEWTTLIDYLGGKYLAGAKLKETGTHHWSITSKEITNETGFTALPGGERHISYSFSTDAYSGGASTGCWWSTSEYDSDLSWASVIYNSDTNVYRFKNYKQNGLTVRLVKD